MWGRVVQEEETASAKALRQEAAKPSLTCSFMVLYPFSTIQILKAKDEFWYNCDTQKELIRKQKGNQSHWNVVMGDGGGGTAVKWEERQTKATLCRSWRLSQSFRFHSNFTEKPLKSLNKESTIWIVLPRSHSCHVGGVVGSGKPLKRQVNISR